MTIEHSKEFGIYHWDAFDNQTILIDEADTYDEALTKVDERYADRVSKDGADKVEIVNREGQILGRFNVR